MKKLVQNLGLSVLVASLASPALSQSASTFDMDRAKFFLTVCMDTAPTFREASRVDAALRSRLVGFGAARPHDAVLMLKTRLGSCTCTAAIEAQDADRMIAYYAETIRDKYDEPRGYAPSENSGEVVVEREGKAVTVSLTSRESDGRTWVLASANVRGKC